MKQDTTTGDLFSSPERRCQKCGRPNSAPAFGCTGPHEPPAYDDEVHARADDPWTAKAAAAKLNRRGRASKIDKYLVAAILKCEEQGGATSLELVPLMAPTPRENYSSRLTALCRKGVIVKNGTRLSKETGCRSTVYRVAV